VPFCGLVSIVKKILKEWKKERDFFIMECKDNKNVF